MITTAARRLVSAVLLRACRDAQGNDLFLAGEARRWLADDGVKWAEELDLAPERVSVWLEELPALPWEQLPLAL